MNKILIVFLLSISHLGISQTIDLDAFIEARGVVNDNLYSLYNTKPEVKGTKYLFEDWKPGKMYFNSKLEQNNIDLNYQLETQTLEIKYEDEVKVCPINLLESFILQNGRTFVNISRLADNAKPALAEILYISPNLTLLEKPTIQIEKPNYIASHDVGEKNIIISTNHDYYLVMEGRATQINKKMKKNELLFNSLYGLLLDYFKENKLNLKKKEDMVKLIQLYDTHL